VPVVGKKTGYQIERPLPPSPVQGERQQMEIGITQTGPPPGPAHRDQGYRWEGNGRWSRDMALEYNTAGERQPEPRTSKPEVRVTR